MQLACKRLVVAHDERWDVELFDDVSHGEGLAATGHAQQDASFLSLFQLRNQFFNCFWLIAGRFELGVESKPLDVGPQLFQRCTVQSL